MILGMRPHQLANAKGKVDKNSLSYPDICEKKNVVRDRYCSLFISFQVFKVFIERA